MATIQQLEKLHHIQRLFHVEDSLEAAVAGERVKLLIEKTEQLIRQRAFLREERRVLRISAEKLEERKQEIKLMRQPNWVAEQLCTLPKRCIQVNVGGLMFEVSEMYMRRDPASLLNQLCDANPPLLPDADGSFFFDRDWWLFRYIVVFLRDGTLPEDRALLAQLYREAGFWHLQEMQKAIEEDKLHLRGDPAKDSSTVGTDGKIIEAAKVSAWWRKVPNWHKAVVDDAKALAGKGAKADWWTGTSYNGRSYMPMSSDPLKVVTTKGAKDSKPVPENTWYAYSEQKKSGYGNSAPMNLW